MNAIKYPATDSIEIHIRNSDTFCKKFGKRVRKMVGGSGGRYNDTRGHQNNRYVVVPCNEYKMTDNEYNTQMDLVDEIIATYYVDCVMVRDNTRYNMSVSHSRPKVCVYRQTKRKDWNPHVARKYIELAKAKYLELAENSKLCEGQHKTVFVLGKPNPSHFHETELYNMYARAWRIVWRQTVDKVASAQARRAGAFGEAKPVPKNKNRPLVPNH